MTAELDIRPARLWKQMEEARRLAAAQAFWRDESALEQQVEAVGALARMMKFRTQSVVALPLDKKARYLASMPTIPDAVAARAIVSYHFENQRPLMAAFLDELGIAHENGLISEESVETPAAERLGAAARAIAGRFPLDDVALYLATLAWQDPDTWGALTEVPEITRP
jgi:hypothetical protein